MNGVGNGASVSSTSIQSAQDIISRDRSIRIVVIFHIERDTPKVAQRFGRLGLEEE